jgi:cation:H+ antiporter
MEDVTLFILAAFAIIVAGSLLAVFADVIVSETGLGALWFGGVAVALITSLPELVTDISAVRNGNHDLALGDLFGSSMANMAILATMTLVFQTRRLLQRAALENVLSAMLAMALSSLAIVFIAARTAPAVADVGLGTMVIFAVYLFGTFAIRERQNAAEVNSSGPLMRSLTLRQAQVGFVLAAAMILVAGPQLARSADALAEQTGLGETFFGAFALALVTSLPELSVSVSALRIGAQDLAIANLLGSNATNMALLLPLDVAYREGPILQQSDPSVLVAAGAAVLLMSIGAAAIVLKAERGRLPVDRAAVLMLIAYAAGLWATYNASSTG